MGDADLSKLMLQCFVRNVTNRPKRSYPNRLGDRSENAKYLAQQQVHITIASASRTPGPSFEESDQSPFVHSRKLPLPLADATIQR
jgi:hypothetical protein